MIGFNAGTAWVKVKPDLTGVHQIIKRELDGVDKTVSDQVSKGLRESTKGIKPATLKVNAETAQARAEIAKLEKSVKDAQATQLKAADALTAAKQKEADAVGQVRVAEEKLTEVRKNSRAKASQVAAAEERLAKARRSLESAQKGGRLSTAEIQSSNAEITSQTRRLQALRLEAERLDGKDVTIDVNTRGAAKASSFLGQTSLTMGQMLVGATALGSALIPVTAAVAGLGAALATPLAAAGGGLTLYGIIAGVAVSRTKEQIKEIDKLREAIGDAEGGKERAAAVKAYQQALDQLSPAQKRFMDAENRMSSAFDRLMNRAGGAIFGPLVQGMNLISRILPRVAPLLNVVSDALTGVLRGIARSVEGPAFKTFLGFFERFAGPAIKSFAAIMRNIASGVFGLVRAFAPLGGQMLRGLVGLTDQFAKFGQNAGKNSAIQQFIAYVRDVGPKVVAFFRDLVGAAVRIVKALAPIGEVVLGGIGLLVRLIRKIPVDVLTAVIGAVLGIVGALKVMQAVMAINPATLIIAAVVALVAALIYAYKHSKRFREIVNAVWDKVKRAISVAWHQVIKPALKAFGDFIRNTLWPTIKRLWNNVVKPVFSAIGRAIKWAWNNVIKPLFKAWWWYLSNVLFPVIRFLWSRVVKPVFRLIGAAIKFWWTTVVRPVFAALKWFFQNVVFPVIRWLWTKVVKPVFKLIGDGIRIWWNNVIKPVFNKLKTFFQNVLFPIFRFLWTKVVKPVFGWIGDHIGKVWQRDMKPVFRAIGSFIRDTVVPAFRRGVDAIARAWDWLKSAAMKPVNFVIETVYNNGLRKFVNSVLEKFPGDAPKLPYVSPIRGARAPDRSQPSTRGRDTGRGLTRAATGAVLPGFTPGRDVHMFSSPTAGKLHLSGGEAIMVPEWTAAVGGPRAVARMNADAMRGRRMHGPLNRRHLAFARGGINPVPGGVTNPHGTNYYGADWAGDFAVPIGTPVKAYREGRVAFTKRMSTSYGNHIGLNHPGGISTLYAHLSSILVRAGQAVRAAQVIGKSGSTGNSTGPHLHFEIDGAPFAPSGDSGGGVLSWIGRLAARAVEKLTGPIMGLIDKVPGADTPFGSIVAGAGKNAVKSVADWVTSKFGGDTGAGAGFSGKAVGAAQRFAKGLLSNYGWGPKQFGPLKSLWNKESGWRWNADNPTSSAYGIPQALPGSKMASAGADWRTNPATQIRWGLGYIKGRYGSPARAWAHSQAHNWYARGGVLPTLFDNGGWLNPDRWRDQGRPVNRTRKPEPVFTNQQWQLLKRAITAVTMNQGRPISADWLRGLTREVPKSAEQLRREFLRLREALRPVRVRTERARRRLNRIRSSDRFERRDEARDEAVKAFEATRSGEAIGEDVSETRREARRALRRARRSPMGRDALRDYRKASRELEKKRSADVVEESIRRTKWRRSEAREALKSERGAIRQAKDALDKAQKQREDAKTKEDKRTATRAIERAREELKRVRKQPDSARERQAREEIKRTGNRLEKLRKEQNEIEKLTKQRDRAGGQSEAVKDLVAARKRLEELREERKERQRLRREARKAGRADILVREEKAQDRLNKRIEAEKKARDAAKKAAQAYRAAQQAALERARTLTASGIELGSIGSATSKTSTGILSNLRRSVRTVTEWGQVVKALIGRGLKGPILEEFIDAGPSLDAVRTGKSLLAGGKIGEINALQEQLRKASTNAAATASASYTPAQRAAIRRATPIKYQPTNAQNKMREVHTHVHGMPSDTADMIANKAANRVMYRLNREEV